MLSPTVRQVDLEPGVSGFETIAELSGSVVGALESAGLSLIEEKEHDEAGPTRWAAVEVASGEQFLLVHHYRHPLCMLDVRARAFHVPPGLVMSRLLHALGLMPEVYDVLGEWAPRSRR